MPFKDNPNRYGWFAIALHWLIALPVIGLFGLGLWMVELDYYHNWYQSAPELHKGLGFIVIVLMLLRLVWRRFCDKPESLPDHQRWEMIAASAAHHSLNLLILCLGISGYLIVTAKGDPLSVFGLFEIPAVIDSIEQLEDTAGLIHEILAWGIIALATIHAAAAFKHHFIDRDRTLLRMLGRP